MKGILFTPDLIKAIPEGRKTQTRRIMKLNGEVPRIGVDDATFKRNLEITKAKPRYQVGETVYIKERALYWDGGAGGCSDVVYQDDSDIPQLLEDNNLLLIPRELINISEGQSVVGKWKWRSPRFMPEWAARYFIKITSATPQRLQEITEEDARAEGVEYTDFYPCDSDSYKLAFAYLWDSINKAYPWDSNHWVWRHEFKAGDAGMSEEYQARLKAE